eukprot:2852546-Prymnesium_polylepis.1
MGGHVGVTWGHKAHGLTWGHRCGMGGHVGVTWRTASRAAWGLTWAHLGSHGMDVCRVASGSHVAHVAWMCAAPRLAGEEALRPSVPAQPGRRTQRGPRRAVSRPHVISHATSH